MDIKIKIVSTIQEFEQLKDTWEELVARQSEANIFLEHDWLCTWWKHFGEGKELFILVAYQEDSIVGIAPLMKTEKIGFCCLEFIGSELSDFEGFIFAVGREGAVCQSLIDFFLRKRCADIWRIRRLKENSILRLALEKGQKGRKCSFRLSLHLHKERAPFLDLRGELDYFLKSLKGKFIADTNRLERKLDRERGFIIEDCEAQLDFTFREILAMQSCNKKKAPSLDSGKINFLQDVAEKFRKKKWLSFKALSCEGKIAAVHFGFIYRDAYYYYLPILNNSFRAYGVGRILLKDLIYSSFAQRWQIFDFMLGEEEYKLNWNPQFMSLSFCNIASKTLKGYLAFFLFDKVIPQIKKYQGASW